MDSPQIYGDGKHGSIGENSIIEAYETKVLIERTALKDVSGGGMCFVSKHPGLYSLGQRIFLHICMPATGEKDVASMECTSKVVWTHQMQSGGAEEQQAVIGVSMESLLSFKKSGDD